MYFDDYTELGGASHILGRLNAPNGFRLAPGEYFCLCPYEETHVVLNTKFSSHLQRCRRNYVKRVTDNGNNGEPLAYSHCRYNSAHSVFPPESRYHDDTCGQRYRRFIPSRYTVNGVYNSATMSNTTPVYVNNAKMASSANSNENVPKGKHIATPTTELAKPASLASFAKQMNFDEEAEVDLGKFPDDEGVIVPEEKPEKEVVKMTSRDIHKYVENLKQKQREDPDFDIRTYEDWDLEAQLFPKPTYDPMAHILRQNLAGMKPPGGLSKGDKKAFYKEHRERTDYMFNDNDPTI